DARALKATVSTYPTSGYDLAQVLQNLATGEAIVTVMNEKGAPSPVAWTRLRAPQSSMSPTPADRMAAAVAASPLLAEYGTPVDPISARDILEQKAQAIAQAAQGAAQAAQATADAGHVPAGTITTEQRAAVAAQKQQDAQFARMQKAAAAQASRDAKAAQLAADRAAREKARSDERFRKEAVGAGASIAKKLIGAFFGSTRR
ncbi:MAG: DUF853 domain-containing protein, partial [Actinomycetota bacterium]|nr:DUF853 domain-containing protein [Actinomycetota bacterium]